MRDKLVKHTFGKLAAIVIAGAPFLTTSAHASDACSITSDTVTYYEKREASILVLQYGDVDIRATAGKVRCAEDAENNRQICSVEGKGELLIEGGDQPPKVVELKTDEPGEVHVYSTADLSCGLKSDF